MKQKGFLQYNKIDSGLSVQRRATRQADEQEPLIIKKRGEDGNRIITVRIREDTPAELDRLAAESNRSRNERLNIILAHGVKNIEIE